VNGIGPPEKKGGDPPVNAKGGGLFATTPRTEALTDHNALVCGAQGEWRHACQHDSKILVRLPPDGPHYAKELCEHCGSFLRWVPRPETLEAQRLRAARIARLAMCEALNDWERGFVASVSKFRKLSPKQVAVIDRLFAQYLKGGAQ
jgi:hypothetical protein